MLQSCFLMIACLANCVFAWQGLPSNCFKSATPRQSASSYRTVVTSCDLGLISERRRIVQAALGLALGFVPFQAFADGTAAKVDSKPPPRAATNPPSVSPPAPKPASDEDPMGLGIFGCKFWGLERVPDSGSCQNVPKPPAPAPAPSAAPPS